jgi:hypothetical protein
VVEKTYSGTCHCVLNLIQDHPQSPENLCHCGLDPQSPENANFQTQFTDIDFIMVGTNGVEENDKIYFENCAKLFPGIPLLQYKNIFGESYSASALGVYAAAICLMKGEISKHLFPGKENISSPPRKILCYNHSEGKNHTFVLLSST